MNRTLASLLPLLVATLVGCSTYVPTEEDFDTNYVTDEIYILQQDVIMFDNGFMLFPSINQPRYYLTDDLYYTNSFTYKNTPIISQGSRIQFKQINHDYSWKMGNYFNPVGILLDPPYEGRPVMMQFMSQKTADQVIESTYGKYINPFFLKAETEVKKNNSNQRLEPTPAGAAHP